MSDIENDPKVDKYVGTVKWFSNRKGYGFITPGEDCPVADDVFVHQSTIQSDGGYRTLGEGWEVEFALGKDDGEDGKVKAEDVTAPGGGPVKAPNNAARRPRRRRGGGRGGAKAEAGAAGDEEGGQDGGDGGGDRYQDGEEAGGAAAGGGGEGAGGEGGGTRRGRGAGSGRRAAPREKRSHWHEGALSEDVKKVLTDKSIRTSTGTLDISFGDARIKLGTRSYSSVAHAAGLLAEGSFECDADGNVTLEWKRAIKFDMDSAEWHGCDAKDSPELPTSLAVVDDSVGAVGTDETAATLWGDGPVDPREALEENEFEMRRVVLTTKRK